MIQKFDRTLFGDSFIGAMINDGFNRCRINESYGSGVLPFFTTFGYVLSPFAFLMGIPTQDIIPAGGIMGTKIVLNEFVAILDLKHSYNISSTYSWNRYSILN